MGWFARSELGKHTLEKRCWIHLPTLDLKSMKNMLAKLFSTSARHWILHSTHPTIPIRDSPTGYNHVPRPGNPKCDAFMYAVVALYGENMTPALICFYQWELFFWGTALDWGVWKAFFALTWVDAGSWSEWEKGWQKSLRTKENQDAPEKHPGRKTLVGPELSSKVIYCSDL